MNITDRAAFLKKHIGKTGIVMSLMPGFTLSMSGRIEKSGEDSWRVVFRQDTVTFVTSKICDIGKNIDGRPWIQLDLTKH